MNSSTTPQTQPRLIDRWQLRTRELQFGRRPALMGIVNVTPDSFSDGGKFYTPSLAIEHALRLEDDGADILDLGGESTRPYSESVTEEEELKRVVPVIEGLVGRVSIPISIDTSKANVARAALDLGGEIINDVTGLEGDAEMAAVAVQYQAGVCAMHMQGRPGNMQDNPSYEDVVEDIYRYLEQRLAALRAAGVDESRICLDPGIGFGKTHQHNVTLLKHAQRYLELGRPILVGHSRKGFIGKLIEDTAADRTAGNLGVSLAMALKGIHILRIHDVRATHDALVCMEACF